MNISIIMPVIGSIGMIIISIILIIRSMEKRERIKSVDVAKFDSFAEEILDRTEFETFKAKYDQSLEEIRQATVEELMEIPEMNERTAQEIVAFFASQKRPPVVQS